MSAVETEKIYVIGVGNDGLTGLMARPRQLLLAADLILGSEQTLKIVSEIKAERLAIGPNLQEVLGTLENNLGKKRMVVVASGDPLFYGVARFLCDRLGKERFEVIPHVSSMQLAFARVKESWEEAFLTNLASHSLDSVLDRIRVAEIVGLFTSEEEDPPTIARQLLARGLDYFRAYVCENLGSPDERVTQGELTDIADMEFAPLNVMILKRKPGRPDLQRQPSRFRRFANPDEVFVQAKPRGELITQAEVRALALAEMDVQPASVVWDIGAGSGSVAIEAAQLATQGMVYAVEKDLADYHLIVANAQTFGVHNLQAIHGTAPGVLTDLPAPDAVFVGGIGSEVVKLVETVHGALRPGGRLVVNLASLEALAATYAALKAVAGRVQALLVSVARGTEQLETLRFEAVNPTFLLWVVKER